MVNRKNYTPQILSLSVFLVIVSVCIVTFLNIKALRNESVNDIKLLEENYIAEQKRIHKEQVHFIASSIEYRKRNIQKALEDLIKNRVDDAVDIANGVYEANKGKLSDTQIKEVIKAQLSSVKFDNKDGYFFAVDLNTSKIIVHKVPRLIGYSMENHKDAKGLHVLNLQKEIFKKGDSGFHDMYFIKPDTKEEYPKRVYVKHFKPYNWLIGTGEYYDTIEEQNQQYVIERFNNMPSSGKHQYVFIGEVIVDNDGKTFIRPLVNRNAKKNLGKAYPIERFTDSKGDNYFKRFIAETAETNEAYIRYFMRKPDTGEDREKLSYVYMQKDWNWIIGSGFYFDDLDAHVLAREKKLKEATQKNITNSIILAIFLSISSGLIAFYMATKINNTIRHFNDALNRMNETLLEQIEAEVEKNRKQEQFIYDQKKFADMGQMINAIAHQWRQPLNSIQLISDMMEDIYNGEEFDVDYKALHDQHGELVSHMSETIDDFRNFFSPNKQKTEFNVVRELLFTLDLLNQQFINSGVSLRFKCNCKMSGIDCDNNFTSHYCNEGNDNMFGFPSELRQVFLNLLSNAKDAILDSDSEKKDVDITVNVLEDYVDIQVFNYGDQISEDILSKIFDPYFTTKSEGKGTGLGLYMSKLIIEDSMDGSLTCENTAGGVTFYIKLPIN